MTTGMWPSPTRTAATLIALTLGLGLFASGVWAGSARHSSDQPTTVQARSSFWSHDLRTGNPTGPTGQLDFWNYDPATGAKIADYSPSVSPVDLPRLWMTRG